MGGDTLSGLGHVLNFREVPTEKHDLSPDTKNSGPIQCIWNADEKAALRILEEIDQLKRDNERLKDQLSKKQEEDSVKLHARHVLSFIDEKFVEATRVDKDEARRLYKLMADINEVLET